MIEISQMIDWNDPAERADLIEEVGPAEYERLQALYFSESVLTNANGYAIVPVPSRFGTLYSVFGTDVAFSTLTRAVAHANSLPPGNHT